jgi:hypothetical protein
LPPLASTPLQPPEAVHDVALLELHVSVEDPPLGTVDGTAVNMAVGVIATEAVAGVLVPPGPVQVSEYDVLELRAPVPWFPLLASTPLQPPEAVHDVALLELHLSVEDPPLGTVDGMAVNVAVGMTATGAVGGALIMGWTVLPQATSNSAAPVDPTKVRIRITTEFYSALYPSDSLDSLCTQIEVFMSTHI